MVEGIAAPTVINSGVFQPSAVDTTHPVLTDTTAPLLLSSFPANGDANIDIDALNRGGIHLAFDEPINTTFMQISLRAIGSFALHWPSWAYADSLHLFPTLGQQLRKGMRYQLSISRLQDLSGNIADDIVIHFSFTDSTLTDSTLTDSTLTDSSHAIIVFDLDPTPGNQGRQGLEEVSVGDLIPIELHILHAPEIGGWSATLEYDSAQLRYADDSFQHGDFIPDLTSLVDDKEGVLKIGGALLGSDQTSSGHGQLGTVFFKVLEGFSNQTQISATRLQLSVGQGERLRYDVEALATLFEPHLPAITLDFDLAAGDQEKWQIFEVHPGDIHHLQLNIRHAPLINGWSATLRYDLDQLHYVDDSFRPSTFIPGLEALVDSKNGEVTVGGAVLGTAAQNSGEGTLGSLFFLVSDLFSGETSLEVVEISLHQPDGTLIKHQEISQARFSSGGGWPTAMADIEAIPSSSQLFPNFPNPFNASTALPFQIADAGPVCLEIFDIQGRQIRALFSGYLDLGYYRFIWNGAGQRSIPLATEIYLVRLRAGNWSQIRKIALIK